MGQPRGFDVILWDFLSGCLGDCEIVCWAELGDTSEQTDVS